MSCRGDARAVDCSGSSGASSSPGSPSSSGSWPCCSDRASAQHCDGSEGAADKRSTTMESCGSIASRRHRPPVTFPRDPARQ